MVMEKIWIFVFGNSEGTLLSVVLNTVCFMFVHITIYYKKAQSAKNHKI